ncbi:MAG: NfeD family protein [Tissierellales bacterium]|jgi:membrane protein implicated in regulation of membrane protease activity|nr:NfeD family protein [Tissierellales bacterium]
MMTFPYYIAWLVLAVILAIIELLSLNLTTIWFALAALISFFVALTGLSTMVQIVVFLITSILLLIFTKPFVQKYLKVGSEKTNIDSLIGKEALVKEDINNIEAQGLAYINGQTWTARNIVDQVVPAGTIVIVEKIEGVKLIIKEKE